MSRWTTVAQPSAELTVERGPVHDEADKTTVTYYVTANGKRFAKVVEDSGFVFWMQWVDTAA